MFNINKQLSFILTILSFAALLAEAQVTVPSGFQPTEEDFLDDSPRGQFMGIPRLRGRPLKPEGGIQGIYLVLVPSQQSDPDLFRVGDVLTELNGQPLIKDQMFRVKSTMAEAAEDAETVTMKRWREGVAMEVTYTFDKPTAPDLTAGGKHDPAIEDWTLGATGAHGWTWAIPHKTTEGATQAYVTKVEAGSPADGVLAVGDVIVGAGGRDFSYDFRKEFAAALTEAERAENGGNLKLRVWNRGVMREAAIQLEVMGSYASGALASPKTDRIVDEAVGYLMEKGIGGGISSYVNALGLLATGREDVMPMVSEFAARVAQQPENNSAWTNGYATLFLCEYHLVTGDEQVLPAIRRNAGVMARGQSDFGTWGHSMCRPYPFSDGPIVGIAPGYGALNQAGGVCMVALSMATRCGVNSEEIQRALQRGRDFFKFYVDKGAIPYGDHNPSIRTHDDNGKTSIVAVAFDLMGEVELADFFSKMTTASFNEREGGHTGNYFSMLWGPLGAARSGDAAAAAFMEKLGWFFEFERGWRGNFDYQGKPGMPNRRGSEHAYKGWDCTGARLLAYSLPRKNLYITGKGRSLPDIGQNELDAVVEAGEFMAVDPRDLSASQLLEKLKSWSPAARQRAAFGLSRKSDDVSDQLRIMLESDNRFVRYGACQGLRTAGRGSPEAADTLVAKTLSSRDEAFVFFAVRVFESLNEKMGMGSLADRASPAFLELASGQGPQVSLARLKPSLSQSLFYSANSSPIRSFFRNGEGLDTADSDVVVEAVRQLLKSHNGLARSQVSIVYDQLSEEQLKSLWPDIYLATRELAPSGIMFANGVRTAGIDLMAKHRTREGLDTAIWYLTNQKLHGGESRTQWVLDRVVEVYGGHAKSMIPRLKKVIAHCEAGEGMHPLKASQQKADMVREAIRKIEAAPEPDWEMESIAQYL